MKAHKAMEERMERERKQREREERERKEREAASTKRTPVQSKVNASRTR